MYYTNPNQIHSILMRTHNLLLFGMTVLLLATSCVSTKKLIYLQGADKLGDLPEQVTQNYELTIQKDDQLAISLSSRDKELLEPFGNKIQLGQNAMTTSSFTSGGLQKLNYIQVDADGNILVPMLGKIKAEGLSLTALQANIEKKLTVENYMKDPQVTVKLMNFKVAVLGDVKTPRQVDVMTDRITILEALAQAGDLNVSAVRNNILVLREEDGVRTSHVVDLTNSDLTKSPYYYLKQNDVIYVEPNNSIAVNSSPFWTYFSKVTSVASLAISIITLIIISR